MVDGGYGGPNESPKSLDESCTHCSILLHGTAQGFDKLASESELMRWRNPHCPNFLTGDKAE